MKLAYFSPLNPTRSGISDFSEELLPFLGEYFEIGVFASEKKIENENIRNDFSIHRMQDYRDAAVRNHYDAAVFHIGNNYEIHKEIADMYMEYGGILELHDVAMHHYLAEETILKGKNDKYLEIMEYCHGKSGRQTAENYFKGLAAAPWENQSMKYTVNKHFIDRAQAVIVHSDFAKQMVKGVNHKARVICIPLHAPKIYEDFEQQKINSRNKLHINSDELVFGTFGNITRNKRIDQILQALQAYKRENDKFKLIIAGNVHGINIQKKAKKMDLQNHIVETGYLASDRFEDYMKACDIVFNLRYPIQGESSASLHKMLGMGKAVLVTDAGPFKEYPDEIVYKINHGGNEIKEILKVIKMLEKQKDRSGDSGKRIVHYADQNLNLQKHAAAYKTFFEDILENAFHETGMDSLLDKIFDLGLWHAHYVEHLKSRMT